MCVCVCVCVYVRADCILIYARFRVCLLTVYSFMRVFEVHVGNYARAACLSLLCTNVHIAMRVFEVYMGEHARAACLSLSCTNVRASRPTWGIMHEPHASVSFFFIVLNNLLRPIPVVLINNLLRIVIESVNACAALQLCTHCICMWPFGPSEQQESSIPAVRDSSKIVASMSLCSVLLPH